MNRLTVVVPTYNRPQLLPRALDSLYKQLVPVNVIVADDGDTPEETEKQVKSLMPDAQYIYTGKWDHSWPNWRAGARAAKSEFVAWLQDDDKVKPNYSARIIDAFDQFPDANVWYARLVIAIGEGMAIWNCGNGPWVPVDMVDGKPYSWAEGSVLTSSAYFTSWSLAPAFAFRNNVAFKLACDRMPEHCDIFVERLIPALTANGGPFIGDPTLAGYWMQHDDHLSTKQHKDQPAMTKILFAELDRLMEHMGLSPRGETWEESFIAWATCIPTQTVLGWVNQLDTTMKEGGPSKYAKEVQHALIKSLNGRIELSYGVRRWWQSAVHKAANWLVGA